MLSFDEIVNGPVTLVIMEKNLGTEMAIGTQISKDTPEREQATSEYFQVNLEEVVDQRRKKCLEDIREHAGNICPKVRDKLVRAIEDNSELPKKLKRYLIEHADTMLMPVFSVYDGQRAKKIRRDVYEMAMGHLLGVHVSETLFLLSF